MKPSGPNDRTACLCLAILLQRPSLAREEGELARGVVRERSVGEPARLRAPGLGKIEVIMLFGRGASNCVSFCFGKFRCSLRGARHWTHPATMNQFLPARTVFLFALLGFLRSPGQCVTLLLHALRRYVPAPRLRVRELTLRYPAAHL